MTQTTLKTTPLHKYHLEYNAQMVDYAGWEMPIKYETSIHDEHTHCRTNGSLFDVSHMGRLSVKGKDAARLFERVCTRRIGICSTDSADTHSCATNRVECSTM